jgi:transcriptional regulator with XRE-family HTH domain
MSKSKSIHSPAYSDLMEFLTKERKRLGLSQSDVAEAIGMSQSDISKIEKQERRIDVYELKRLLLAYRIEENPQLRRYVSGFFGVDNEG